MLRFLAVLIFMGANAATAQKTAMFNGVMHKVYPYRMEVKSGYDMNSEDEYVIPPTPANVPDGTYIVWYNTFPTDSVRHISPRVAATCTFQKGMLQGLVSFYDYRHDYPSDKARVISSGQYLNHEKTGKWHTLIYSDYGLIMSSEDCHYNNDLKHGAFKSWDVNSQYSSGQYTQGVKTGTWQLNRSIRNYDQGELHGRQVDTISSLVKVRSYNRGELTGIEYYNILNHFLEYKIENIDNDDHLSRTGLRFADDLIGGELEYSNELGSACTLKIYNNNTLEYTIHLKHEKNEFQSNYIKHIHEEVNGDVTDYIQELRVERVNEFQDHPAFVLKKFKDSVLQEAKVYERYEQYDPILYSIDPVGSELNYSFSPKYYIYSLGYLPEVFTLDSTLYVNNDTLYCRVVKGIFSGRGIERFESIQRKRHAPFINEIFQIDTIANTAEMTEARFKFGANVLEKRVWFALPGIIPASEISTGVSFKIKGVHCNRISMNSMEMLEQPSNFYGMFYGHTGFTETLYLNGNPFNGTVILKDTQVHDEHIGERIFVTLWNKKELVLQQSHFNYHFDESIDAINDHIPPYCEFIEVPEKPKPVTTRFIRSIDFKNGLVDGQDLKALYVENGRIYLTSVQNYAMGRPHGLQVHFNEYDYHQGINDSTILVDWSNVNQGFPNGLQFTGTIKRDDSTMGLAYKVVQKKYGTNYGAMIKGLPTPVPEDTLSFFHIYQGNVYGDFIFSNGQERIRGNFSDSGLGDTIQITYQDGQPSLTIALDEHNSGSFVKYERTKTSGKVYKALEILIQKGNLISPWREYYEHGGLAMEWDLKENDGGGIKKIVNEKRFVIRGFQRDLFVLDATLDPYKGLSLTHSFINGISTDLMDNYKLSGNVKYYYPSGVFSTQGYIHDGKKIGIWTYYNIQGKPYLSIDKKYGYKSYLKRDTLEYRMFDSLGAEMGTGRTAEISYESDCESSEAMPYIFPAWIKSIHNAIPNREIDGDPCVFIILRRYNMNKFAEGVYCKQSNAKEGVWKFYKKNGMLEEIGQFKDNEKTGRWINGDLDGINYLEDICFDPKDTEFIISRMKNIEFEQQIYENGKLLKSIKSKVKLDNRQEIPNWGAVVIQRYFLPLPTNFKSIKHEDPYYYYRSSGVVSYMGQSPFD